MILRLIAEYSAALWALQLDVLEAMDELLQRALFGRATEEELHAAIQARAPRVAPANPGARESVAVIPVGGVIAHRANMVDDICGPRGTSTEALDRVIRAAAADPAVRSIVLDVNSPGGSVYGVPELAATIMEARAQKPIAAVANATAASAAYWIASAAHEIFVIPSGEVGSIGVYAVHQDLSRSDEMMGKRTTIISAGKYKAEGEGSLTDEARAHIQHRVDAYYRAFVQDVARHRNVPVDRVRDGYGEGRTLGAQEALKAGMVDGILTLPEVIARYSRRTLETANRGRSVALDASAAIGGVRRSVAAAKLAIAAAAAPITFDKGGRAP